MHKLASWTLLALLAAGSIGCVPQQRLDRYRTLYRESKSQIVELQTQLEEAESRIQALKNQEPEPDPATQKQLAQLRDERDRLRQALDKAEQRLREARTGPVVEPELDSALAELARNNDELTYKPDKGMVKFQSDITFALGSAQVSDEVRGTIQKLANVLQRDVAKPYEVRIVGHTDDVPIKKPATKKKHPTNWHLSVHRAIAIERVLEGTGVSPKRMSVAGYGPYRPIAPNNQNGNRKNRRVEVYLVRMNGGNMGAAPSPGGGSATSSGGASDSEPARTKGTGGSDDEDQGPIMYK